MSQVANELVNSSPISLGQAEAITTDTLALGTSADQLGIANQPVWIKINKTDLAKALGISRGMLYYHHKQAEIDEQIRLEIEGVLSQPRKKFYGHRRVAIELGYNKKRVRRIMNKYGIKPKRRKPKRPRKKEDENQPEARQPNLIKNLCPLYPNVIWVADFTYLKFQGRFVYLATIEDLYTREIVGWQIATTHDRDLVIKALLHALDNTGEVPIYLHFDQGSEYLSNEHLNLVRSLEITISLSKKASPWENGYKESWYSHFKLEFESTSRYQTLGELVEAIYQAIRFYNQERPHTAYRMAPAKVRQQFEQGNLIRPKTMMNDSREGRRLRRKLREEAEKKKER